MRFEFIRYLLQNFIGADGDGQVFNTKAAGMTAAAAVNIKFHPSASFMVSILWYMASR